MLLERCPMRVFWPSTLPRHTLPGVVVGWQNSPLEYFVLTILEAVEVGERSWSPLYDASRI